MKKDNIIYILFIIIIVGVSGYSIYKHFNYEIPDGVIPYSVYIDVIDDDNGYVAIGMNNYYKENNAKYNSNKDIILQGQFIKFDKNLNIVKKIDYNDNNDNGFMPREIIKTDDGYILTGVIMPLNSVKSVVIKLDKDLNVVKKIYLNELDSTVAIKMIKDNDRYTILTHTYKTDGETISDDYNVIFELDKDLNIVNKIIYKENYVLNQMFLRDNNYLLIGNNEKDSIVVVISKDTSEVLSTKITDIPNQYELYFYNNKLYTSKYVYDLENDTIIHFSGENLSDNHILLIDNDVIYVSHPDPSDNNYSESIYTYDLNMNKIKEYKLEFENIDKIINYNDRLLVIGRVSHDDSVIPIIKYVEK